MDEVGKFKKIFVLQYRLFLFRRIIIEMIKKFMEESEQLIKAKSDSKEELELNIKRVTNRVTETYLHNLIQIFGVSKVDKSLSNRTITSNLDLNQLFIVMENLGTEFSEELKGPELLQRYFHLDEQDARDFSEVFTYLALREKAPNKISADPTILSHMQKISGVLEKVGQISNEKDKSYSKAVYLKLIGFLLYDYMTDSSDFRLQCFQGLEFRFQHQLPEERFSAQRRRLWGGAR